jgi:hypothetical protein
MGFLIDAVAHGLWGEQRASADLFVILCVTYRLIWLRLSSCTVFRMIRHYAGLTLMVWVLKREVRASGGCLGMYRR